MDSLIFPDSDEWVVIQDMTLGDKGFIRPILKEDLASQDIDLHTLLRSNMKENRPRGFML